MCSAPIRAGRAAEISAGLQTLLGQGYSALFSTFTMPHDFGDDLDCLLPALKRSWSSLNQGRFGMEVREEFGIVGLIRALEVTFGKNGWHPHLHVLFVFRCLLDDARMAEFDRVMFARYASAVEVEGYRAPTRERGLVTRRVVDSSIIANYVAKVETMLGAAMELAAANTKRGRGENLAPFELLSLAAADVRALRQFRKYEQAFKGSRAVLWSPGLKERAGVVEAADDVLIESDGGSYQPLFPIDLVYWRRIVRMPGFYRGLYRSIECGGAELGADFVAGLLCQSMEVAA